MDPGRAWESLREIAIWTTYKGDTNRRGLPEGGSAQDGRCRVRFLAQTFASLHDFNYLSRWQTNFIRGFMGVIHLMGEGNWTPLELLIN